MLNFQGLYGECGSGNCTRDDEYINLQIFFSSLDVMEYTQDNAYGVKPL